MRIVSADISSFGSLRDRVLKNVDAPVVCIAGPNEAGKSTLYSFLTAMLFGFPSRSVHRKQFVPPSGGTIGGRLKFRLADGSEHLVVRSADTTLNGVVQSGDGLFVRDIQIENEPVPFVSHVSRLIFENVHALSLDELQSLDAKTFGAVRERLLGALDFDHVRPVHEVLGELEREAALLWRSDNRGKPLDRSLAAEMDAVQKRMERVRQAQAERNLLAARLPQLESGLQRKESDLRSCESELDELGRLATLSADSRRARSLREQSAIVDGYDDISDSVEVELSALRRDQGRLSSGLAELEQTRERLQNQLVAFGTREMDLLAHQEAIRALSADLGEYRRSSERYVTERTRVATLDDERRAVIATLSLDESALVRPPNRSDVSELIAVVEEFDRVARELDSAIAKSDSFRVLQTDGKRLLALGVAAATIGLVVVLLGIPAAGEQGPAAFALAGCLLAAVGIATGIAGFVRNRKFGNSMLRLNLEATRAALSVTRKSVQEVAEDIGLSQCAEAIDRELLRDLARLVDLDEQIDSGKSALAEYGSTCQLYLERLQPVGSLARQHEPDVMATVVGLTSELAEAERIAERASQAKILLPDAEQRATETRAELDEGNRLIGRIEERLEQLGSGSVEAGFKLLATGRGARRQSQLIADELARRYTQADEQRLAEFESGGKTADELYQTRRRNVEELRRAAVALAREVEQVRARLDQLLNLESVSSVEQELNDLRERRRTTKDQRDRLILLRNIIRLADQRFREVHEPDVLARASNYLAAVTDGSWVRLRMQEDRALEAVDASGRTHVVAPPMSRGSLDQIFLCLRLGIVDHLDATAERLPVFLDEVLVNWDHGRRKLAYPLIRKLAETRQVFFFTCHEWMREELAVELGALVVDIESPSHTVPRPGHQPTSSMR